MENNKKVCSICNTEKELSQFYKQKKTDKDGNQYIYYQPDCKECTKKRADKWQRENRDRVNELARKHQNTEKGKIAKYNRNKRYREGGSHKRYYDNNKDKFREYNLNRSKKNHDITSKEWEACKEYFNYSCAYCGISEEMAVEVQKQKLHKEHVDFEGANDLSNCIPSCRKCNSHKWKYSLDEWYNVNNINYTYERKEKIIKWLKEDYIEVFLISQT